MAAVSGSEEHPRSTEWSKPDTQVLNPTHSSEVDEEKAVSINGETDHTSDSNKKTATEDEKEIPKRTVVGLKWALCYASILSTVLLYALDGTIVAVMQPNILDDLGGIELLPWISVALALGTSMILPLGKAYGVFNVKWLFMSMVVTFGVGSVVCGAAPNMSAFIVGRVLQGVGGCGCYTGALTSISMITTPHERPLYLSGILVVWGIGSVVGPIIGGAFADSSATWRWGFYINLVVAAVLLPGLIFTVPSLNPVELPFLKKLKTQDWLGILVFTPGCVCLTLALSFGGTVYAFDSGSEIALWVVTGVLLIAFLLVTRFHPGSPKLSRLYPIHLQRNWELNILQLAIFVSMGALMLTLYYTPLIFQFTRGDEALMAGVRLLPFMAALIALEVINGAVMPKHGYYMPWYVLGNALLLVGAVLMFTMDTGTSDAKIYGYTLLIGAGVGCSMTAGFAVAQTLVSASDLSNSVGFIAIGQMWGQIVVLSVGGSIYQNISLERLRDAIPGISNSGALQLTTGTHGTIFESLSRDNQDQVVHIVTDGMRYAFALLIPISGLALIGSLFLSDSYTRPTRGKQLFISLVDEVLRV